MKYYLLFLLLTGGVLSAQNTDKIKRATDAYAYILGQDYKLDWIEKEFPELKINTTKARLLFNAKFAIAKDSLKNFLIQELGKEKFDRSISDLFVQAEKIFSDISLTKASSIEYILDVEKRINGEMPSPIVETILSFQYKNVPHQEFLDGFTFTFETKGHSKSKNTDWKIKVPKSWKQAEGDRPNIIQKFISDYGEGQQTILLLVKDIELPKDYVLTKEELDDIFSKKEMQKTVPSGGKFINFKKMTFDGKKGGMLELEQVVERLDTKYKVRMKQFVFIHQNKMYFLQCSSMTWDITHDLSEEMNTFTPLFLLVANSIVLNNQYK